MADIAIKMGVNAPADDVNGVLSVLNYIHQQNSVDDNNPFIFQTFEDDFSDGAIGVLASMSVIINYDGLDGISKSHTEHILQSFERVIIDEKRAFSVVISPLGRKLVDIIYEQRDREGNEDERSRFVQSKVAELGLE